MKNSREMRAVTEGLNPSESGQHGRRSAEFAVGLQEGHVVRSLLVGDARWLEESKHVVGFIRLFCWIYQSYLMRADWAACSTMPIDPEEVRLEHDEFERLFPDDVIFRGHRYRLRRLLKQARASIAVMAGGSAHLQASGERSFDLVFARLVRTVRLS